MATWDITTPPINSLGSGGSGSVSIITGRPSDFDGATIDSVTVLSAPLIGVGSSGATNDTIGIRWRVTDISNVDTHGSDSSDAASLCHAANGDGSLTDTIVVGSSPSPAPTTAVAGDWSNLEWAINYAANMKNDGENVSVSLFTIRVTYTPLTRDLQQDRYRFCTPTTGAAHESYTLVGTEDVSFEIATSQLDVTHCLIIKIGNDGTGGSGSTEDWQLEYNVDGGGWNDVNGSSSNVRSALTGDTDGAVSTTGRLTSSGRIFGFSLLDEVNGLVENRQLSGSVEDEYYWGIRFRSADLSGGESITFRVTHSLYTVTYAITPTATIEAAGNTTALGTITFIGDLASVGEHTGVTGTIVFIGDLAATGLSLESAIGTITFSGDLAADGASNAFAVTSFIGELIAGGGANLSTATSTFIGDLAAVGINLVPALGTITITGDLAADGTTLSAGTSTVIGDLAAIGEHTGVTATTTFSATLAAIGTDLSAGLEEASSGLSLGSADHKSVVVPTGPVMQGALLDTVAPTTALGTITFIGDLAAIGEHTGVTGTSTFIGDLVADGTTNARGTITVLGVGISEGIHLAQGTITVTGDLVATGISLQPAVGTITFIGDLAATAIALQPAVGTITFIGNLVATGVRFFVAYGTITATGDLVADGKNQASGTTTFIGDLAAIGTDISTGIVNALGIITFIGDLAADGITSEAGVITVIGDLAAVGVGLQPAVGTTTFIGDLAATGIALQPAVGTSTITGDLVSRGTTNASGTITVLGVGISEGIHLASGTITFAGDLAAVAIGLQPAVGTTAFIFEGAASGTQLAGGTSTFSGQLVAVGTEISAPAETLPPGRGTFQSEIPLPRDYSVLPVGIQLEEQEPPAKGTITVIGSLVAQTGNVQVSGTITIIGDLSSLPPHDLFNIASTSIFADEVPVLPSFVFLHRGPPFRTGTFGTIRITGDLAAGPDITQFAFGTITFLGAVSTQQEGFVNATATITFAGDLTAAAETTIVNVSGTINILGSVRSVSANVQAAATITYTGELSSIGTIAGDLLNPTATIILIGKLEAIPYSYCPISPTGTINLIGSLVAVEDPIDDIVTSSGSIRTWGLMSGLLSHHADNGNLLAHAKITFIGDLTQAKATPGTCLTPTATLTMPAAVMSAFGGDLNQKFKAATITWSASLTISAVAARASSVLMQGELTARGRNLPIGTASFLSQRALIDLSGQIGAGTIDGRKTAVINEPYGSLEIYNNGQGGFYSIGANGALKEVFALMNWAVDLGAKGTRDAIKFAKGVITVTGEVTMDGRHTGIAAMAVGVGSLSGYGRNIGIASILVDSDLAAMAAQQFVPTYNGERNPTIIAQSDSSYQDETFSVPPVAFASANASVRIYVVNEASDCLLKVDGLSAGSPIGADNAQALTTIFNLNVRPDSVAIEQHPWPVQDSDSLNYGSSSVKIGSFTDTQNPPTDFDPTNGIEYGWRYLTFVEAQAPGGNPPTGNESGIADAIVSFTFKKSGYADLTLTYRVYAESEARAYDLSM